MLFTIFLVAIVLITVGGGFLVYHTSSYNHADNTASFVCAIVFGGGLIAFLILLGSGSEATKDAKNHVVLEQKTYAIADSSVPTVNGRKGELSFAYVENGQTFPYSGYVDPFSIGMEKPKAFKITRYDVVDHSILPWVINDGVKVEVIK